MMTLQLAESKLTVTFFFFFFFQKTKGILLNLVSSDVQDTYSDFH